MKMKMDFKKGMTLQDIEEVCDNNHQMLWEYQNYLNQDGKELMDTYSVISWYITFSDDIDELAKNLREDITGVNTICRVKPTETKIIRNINNFIKNILER